MTSKKSHLDRARKLQENNEFYTQYEDIEAELERYKHHFKGKIIYCNCDDPKQSKFWQYFVVNFHRFQLKAVWATHIVRQDLFTYDKAMLTSYDGLNRTQREIEGDGDYLSTACQNIIQRADIVVTNPPFSIFREYMMNLYKHNKKFLVIGHIAICSCDQLAPKVKAGELKTGTHEVHWFNTPSGGQRSVRCNWYHNLDHGLKHKAFDSGHSYDPKVNQAFDNNPNIINCPSISRIPMDHDGLMGVPVTFLNQLNLDQFEFHGYYKDHIVGSRKHLFLNGTIVFTRWIIRHRNWREFDTDEYNQENADKLFVISKFGRSDEEMENIDPESLSGLTTSSKTESGNGLLPPESKESPHDDCGKE